MDRYPGNGTTTHYPPRSDTAITKGKSLAHVNHFNDPVCAFSLCAPGACGGSLMTGETPGFLFSPGWPENYPPNQECTWLIRSPNSIVEFNILSLDMEDYPNCYFDSLVIRDGTFL